LEAAVPTTISQRVLREAFGTFATGVTVVTAIRPTGEPIGVTANSFTSVSLDPPLLLWCLAKSSSNVEAFGLDAPFAVHILAHQQRDLALHFARRSREKFEIDRAWRSNPSPPIIADALCRFDCRVHSLHGGGDHIIIVGEVLALQRHSGLPLAFHGGHFGCFAADKGSPQVDTEHAWHGEWV
jgi:3-hydroxy-9,10-secoandrosta-1,3,5(10)-triene-9,17-dione monooxygenase reductase component